MPEAALVADLLVRWRRPFAGRPPLALREAKASIRDASLLTERDHFVAERSRFVGLLGSNDKAEGIAAVREKRPPIWTGK